MPIYAYKCEACGHALDALQKISDAPLRDCPSCGAPALAKQLTAAGFQLKGSGWYATDFKGGASAASAAAPAAAGAPATPATPAAGTDASGSTGGGAAPACGAGACPACT
jgi:putative FmdB family regulatory protein